MKKTQGKRFTRLSDFIYHRINRKGVIMRKTVCIIAFIALMATLFFTVRSAYAGQIVKTYKDWYCMKKVDKLRNTAERYIFTKSTNKLKGWLHNGDLILGYEDNLYMRANGLGFYGAYIHGAEEQTVSLRIDKNEKIFDYDTEIWERDNDGLSFPPHTSNLIDKMKKGREIHIEVILFQTGTNQVADFSLMGFTKAYNWVERKE